MNHITSALPPETHTPMYLMHKYWARKPHNIVNRYIENYTKKGDIVLDPFCGSGVTALESLKLGRKAIAVDVDPMATFITRMTAMPINLKEFEKTFTSIKKNVEHKILSLYKTTCRECKTQVFATHVIWETKNSTEIPTTLWYKCPVCNHNVYQKDKIKNDDIKTIQKIKKMKIPYWYPDNDLIWNTRVNVHKGTKVSDLFTKRALIGLSILLNEIEKITNDSLTLLMKFVFSSALPQASKLVFVIQRRGRHTGKGKKTQEVGSWATRGYWIPPKHFEINVWNCFKNRFKKVLRGKRESNNLINVYNETKKFKSLGKNNKNIFIKTANILKLTDFIPENSIDYIFTDPPYGDSIPYLELDYMWSSWLKFDPHFEDEIVISNSPERNKTINQYETMLHKAFIQVFTVLKPGKFMTVTFHNTDIKIWNSIIRAAVLSGFSLEKIIYQPPARPSPKGLLHPYGSAVGDYYMRFFKPKMKKPIPESEVNKTKYERIVVETAKKLIVEKGEPIPYQYILNTIIPELNKQGVLLKGDKDIKEIMKDHLNNEFVLADVKNEKGELIGHKWWLKDLSCISF